MSVKLRIVAENARLLLMVAVPAFHDIRRSKRQYRLAHEKKAGIISK